jgi:WD40 repeat protein
MIQFEQARVARERTVDAERDARTRIEEHWFVPWIPVSKIKTAGSVSDIQFIANGTQLAVASDNGVRFWELNTNKIYNQLAKGEMRSVAVSDDGSQSVTVAENGRVTLWKLNGANTRSPIRLMKPGEVIFKAAISHDGSRIVAVGNRGATMWDSNGKLLVNFHGHSDGILSVAFSPDGSKVVTGSRDGSAIIWDVTGQQPTVLRILKGHSSIIYSVAFNRSGSKIVTGSGDRTAAVWNLDGQKILSLGGRYGEVKDVAFSPDDSFVLTGHDAKTAVLWDSNTGEARLELKDHSFWTNAVAVSADGSKLATGSTDGITIWIRAVREKTP